MKAIAHEKSADSRARLGSGEHAAFDFSPPAYDFTGGSPATIFRAASCACGGGCPDCQSQSGNLKVSQPTDAAEIEADHVADRVMRMAANESPSSGNQHHEPGEEEEDSTDGVFEIQRQCAACDGEEDPEESGSQGVQRRANGREGSPAHISRDTLTSGGEAMSSSLLSFFEPRFGRHLSNVRLHTGEHAAQTASSLGAHAFTYGSHVWLGPGQRVEANGLMAHELAHVVQQTSPAKRAAATPAHESAMPALSPIARAIQRTACQDATRLHAERAGRPVPAEAAPTAEAEAAEDARWAAAASTIDFAATILESPLGRGILSMLPGPVGMVGGSPTPSTLRLVSAVLPEIRSVWDLLSHPARLMARVRAFIDSQMPGVPEVVRARLAEETFEALRDSRHMIAIGLAVGDAVAELLTNWTTPFVTAWNTFISPFDIDAEMADLACIQERYAAGEINTFEAYTAIYGWVVGWVNRYAVYVTIALVVGGGVIGAAGGTVGGGAVGAAAGGAPAAPGAAAGGGGGFFAGAGAGWVIAEEIGIGILAANAVHMLLEVSAALARLEENDRAVEEDAAAGRTPSAEELERRQRQEDSAYSSIAQVIVNLGIMGALVLLGTFGPQFARVAVAGLSRRYPSLGRYLVSIGARIERSSVGQAMEEFEAGRTATRERLRGGSARRESERRRDTDTETRRDAEPETRLDHEPDAPLTAEPEAPRIAEPEAPRIAEPEAPRVAEPEAPRIAEPEAPRVAEPEAPRVAEPEAPRVAEPEAPRVAEPEAPRTAEPEAPRTAEPEAPRAAEPEAPRTAEPEAPRVAEPEAPRAAEPEAPRTAEPEAPRTAEPEAPLAAEPEAPLAAEPEAPSEAEPAPAPAPLPPAAPPVARTLRGDLATRIDRAIELSPPSARYRRNLMVLRDHLRRATRVLADRRRRIDAAGIAAMEDEFAGLMDDIADACESEGERGRAVADALRGDSPPPLSADVGDVLGEVSEGTSGAAIDPREPGGRLGDPDLPEALTDPTSRATGRAARRALRRAVGPAPPGWQNHHLIPLELRELPAVYEYERLVMGVDNPRATASIGDRIVDQPTNNLPMPSSPAAAGTSGVTIHRGSHPLYTDWMEGRLRALWAERESLSTPEFARRFEDIMGDAEIRLASGEWGPTMQPPRR